MKKTLNTAIAVAACSGEINSQAPAEIKLIPAGEFKARDGRPPGLSSWRLDAGTAGAVIASAARAKGDFVIDYEHQTLHSEGNGQPAPAAGWFKELEWREGDGLYAVDVRWTAKARALIEGGEYRYISPVFQYSKQTGVVTAVLMAALTNYPALDGHSDLAAMAAAKFQSTTEDDMDRKKLIALLGLADGASDEQIEQAMTALTAKALAADHKDAEIASLKAAGSRPDPALFVPVATFEALKSEVAALKATQTVGEVDALISQGLKDGKLLPVQKDWARELGTANVAALKGYLEKTPAIAALSGSQTGGKTPPDDGTTALSADELAVCRNLGVSAEEYRKTQNP